MFGLNNIGLPELIILLVVVGGLIGMGFALAWLVKVLVNRSSPRQ